MTSSFFTLWFTHPWLLVGLCLVPVLVVFSRRGWQQRAAGLALYSGRKASAVPARSGGQLLIRALGLTACLIALAGPRWSATTETTYARGRDLVLILDASRSMYATDVLPNRVGRAKLAVEHFLHDLLKYRSGHRVGLVVFAGQAKVLSPLTHDTAQLLAFLQKLSVEQPPAELLPREETESGTRLGVALSRALALLPTEARGYHDVMLFTDGDDPDPASSSERQPALLAAQAARVPIHVVGLGDPERESALPFAYAQLVTSKLHEAPLRELAHRTGGTYVPAQTKTFDLAQLYRDLVEMQPNRVHEAGSITQYQPRYSWFCALAIFLLAWEMLGARLVSSRRVGLIRLPNWAGVGAVCSLALLGASAAREADAWIRVGNQAFAARDYEAAQAAYERARVRSIDPGLVALNLGVTYARQQRYAESAAEYRQCLGDAQGTRRAQALLGLGVALTQTGATDKAKLREALNLFQECLLEPDLSPELSAACRHNLELAKLLYQQAEEQAPANDKEPANGNKPKPSQGANTEPPKQPTPGQNVPEAGTPGERVPGQADPKSANTSPQTTPGVGTLPVLPDSEELPDLTAEQAAAYLQRAAQLLADAQQSRVPPRAPAGMLDR